MAYRKRGRAGNGGSRAKIQRTGTMVAASSSYPVGGYPSAAAAYQAYQGRQRRRNIRTGGFLGIENKFVDYEVTATAISATVAGSERDPTPGCLSAVAQGDGENQRDGRRYKMNSIHVRGEVLLPADASSGLNAQQSVRLALVIDTQSNAAQMAAETCFAETTTAGQSYQAFRNLQYSGRYVVLCDEFIELKPLAAAGNGTTNDTAACKQVFRLNFKIPEKYAVVDTTGTTANINVITDNSIHLLCWGTTNGITISYESRLRFVG